MFYVWETQILDILMAARSARKGKSRYKITVGKWRTKESGPMEVVSGAYGREIVHYEAPIIVDLAIL